MEQEQGRVVVVQVTTMAVVVVQVLTVDIVPVVIFLFVGMSLTLRPTTVVRVTGKLLQV